MNLFDYIFRYETVRDRENNHNSNKPLVEHMHAWDRNAKNTAASTTQTPPADLLKAAKNIHQKTPYKKIGGGLLNYVIAPLAYVAIMPVVYVARGFFNLSDRAKAATITIAMSASTLTYALHSSETEFNMPFLGKKHTHTPQDTRFEKVATLDKSRAEKVLVIDKKQEATPPQNSHNLVAQFAAYQDRDNAIAAVNTLQENNISTQIIQKKVNNTGQVQNLFAVVSSSYQSCAEAPKPPAGFGCFNLKVN